MSNENIQVTVNGATRVVLNAEVGQTLRRAFLNNEKFKDKRYENMTFKDEKGKPVSLDRKLSENIKLVATAKTDAATASETGLQNTTAKPATPAPAPIPTTPAPIETTAATAKPVAPTPTPTPAQPAKVKVSVTGKISANFEATRGTTLEKALKDAGHVPTGTVFKNESGSAVALGTLLNADTKLSSAARVSGG
jgi:hypothetical protein